MRVNVCRSMSRGQQGGGLEIQSGRIDTVLESFLLPNRRRGDERSISTDYLFARSLRFAFSSPPGWALERVGAGCQIRRVRGEGLPIRGRIAEQVGMDEQMVTTLLSDSPETSGGKT